MKKLYYNIGLLFISVSWLLGPTQANFNMQTSKKYDHYFFNLYHTTFEKHLNDVSKNKNLESNLENYAKKKESRGIVREWYKFNNWNPQYFKHLRQHFLFTVRVAKESTDPLQLLILMYVKQQAYLRAITYMNGAIIFPEKDDRRHFCRIIAKNLLNFSDVGTNDIYEKLQVILQMMYGSTLTNKIMKTLEMWATAAFKIWSKFVPQMKPDNPSLNKGELYQQLCADENEIMLETKIEMMSLFEGIKQGVVKPSLPPKERLTLNFTAALKLWDKSEATWVDHFETAKDKFQLIEMMMQYDKTEMKMYGELYGTDKESLNFDDLKDLNSLDFDKTTGIINLSTIQKESDIIGQKRNNKEELSRKMKASHISGNTQANFDMVTSKKYDHYFLDLYHTAFAKHLNDVSKNPNLELELDNYAKENQSSGIVREWFKFEKLNPQYYNQLHKHFIFAVRVAKESTDPFELLMFMYVKHQAYLRAITYMNGAIIFPENDDRRIFCRIIAMILLNFSDVATIDIFEKLIVESQMTYGSALTVKITKTLEMWVTAAFKIWAKFVPQMISENYSTNIGELYQKLCAEENEIIIETRIAMMSLIEGIKQGVDKPSLPSEERLTLNFAAAFNLWDTSQKTWDDYFEISKDKFQLKDMMIQYDKQEMRMYGELNEVNKEALNFDDLQNFTLLFFDKATGVLKLGKIHKETVTIREENINKEDHSNKMKGKKAMEE